VLKGTGDRMELREDEIEALLRFDGAGLVVLNFTDLTSQAGQPYVALITTKEDRSIAHGDATRLGAVQAAWALYKKYAVAANPEDGYWMYENAEANVRHRMGVNAGLIKPQEK